MASRSEVQRIWISLVRLTPEHILHFFTYWPGVLRLPVALLTEWQLPHDEIAPLTADKLRTFYFHQQRDQAVTTTVRNMKTAGSTLCNEPLCCCAVYLYQAKICHISRRHITICNTEYTKEHWVRNYVCVSVGRDSVVGIATRYGLEGPGIESQWGGGRDYPRLSGESFLCLDTVDTRRTVATKH